MKTHYNVHILAAGLLWAASVPADIVWSGELYQRAYHDISSIDMNQDGTDDFTFNLEVKTLVGTYNYYSIVPTNGQTVREKISDTVIGGGYSLEAGTVISENVDVSGPFDVAWGASKATLFAYGIRDVGEYDYGGFFVANQGYLGVSFEVEGSTHYGWIELSQAIDRPSPENQFLYVHGWAYESTPDTPIVAGVIPEPSTGILTMVGSIGLLLHARSRRRR
jgi:hypothetical protein